MTFTLYHNPACSKSRRTLELIQARGIVPDIVLYLETPPTTHDLQLLLKKLQCHPKSIVRFGESRAEELGITEQDERSDQAWLELLVDNPVLIERPIVVEGDRAILGRPPENVLQLFS